MNVADLANALPISSEDVEQQARAVLRLVLNPILGNRTKPGEVITADATTCPNCGAPTNSTRTPYCGAECREISGFVRQMRSGLADGSISDPDRQIAFGQVLWFILGGGRPLRRHLIPDKVRAQIIQKAGGRCALCAAPAVTVDHTRTGCNRPINLRAVCETCDSARPFEDQGVLGRPEVATLLNELSKRIGSAEPLRCCDDSKTWDWREYLASRQP